MSERPGKERLLRNWTLINLCYLYLNITTTVSPARYRERNEILQYLIQHLRENYRSSYKPLQPGYKRLSIFML